MGGFVSDELADSLIDAVRKTLFSAYSVILMELVAHDEAQADEWLRLTAKGMKMTPGGLARQLYFYNQEALGHLAKWGDEHGGGTKSQD